MTLAVDRFRGAGGWSVACERLGITDEGVEFMPEANATAAAAGYSTVGLDVWDFWYPANYYEVEIASPPCQTFSVAGKGKGREALDAVLSLATTSLRFIPLASVRRLGIELTGDERTALVLVPLWSALVNRPEVICLEQVPTVLPVWERYAEILREQGYSVWTGNLQAEMYGVPQTRKRAILIASRNKEVKMPEPTHSRYYSRSPEKLDPGREKVGVHGRGSVVGTVGAARSDSHWRWHGDWGSGTYRSPFALHESPRLVLGQAQHHHRRLVQAGDRGSTWLPNHDLPAERTGLGAGHGPGGGHPPVLLG